MTDNKNDYIKLISQTAYLSCKSFYLLKILIIFLIMLRFNKNKYSQYFTASINELNNIFDCIFNLLEKRISYKRYF